MYVRTYSLGLAQCPEIPTPNGEKNTRSRQGALPNQTPGVFSHGLEVVALLDLGPPLLAHRPAQLLSLVHRLQRVLQAPALGRRQVDALFLQRDLGRQRLEVARREQPGLLLPLPLERQSPLLLGLGCLFFWRALLAIRVPFAEGRRWETRRKKREKEGERTKLVARVRVRRGVRLLLHLQTLPQPLRVRLVRQRHRIALALEVVEPVERRARGARRARRRLAGPVRLRARRRQRRELRRRRAGRAFLCWCRGRCGVGYRCGVARAERRGEGPRRCPRERRSGGGYWAGAEPRGSSETRSADHGGARLVCGVWEREGGSCWLLPRVVARCTVGKWDAIETKNF